MQNGKNNNASLRPWQQNGGALTSNVDLLAKFDTVGGVDILEHECRFQQVAKLLRGEHHRFPQPIEVLDVELEDVERLC